MSGTITDDWKPFFERMGRWGCNLSNQGDAGFDCPEWLTDGIGQGKYCVVGCRTNTKYVRAHAQLRFRSCRGSGSNSRATQVPVDLASSHLQQL